MNSVTVAEELVMELRIRMDQFLADAKKAERTDEGLRKSFKETEKQTGKTGDSFGELSKELTGTTKNIMLLAKRVGGFFTLLTGSNALTRLTQGIAKANDQLGFMAQRMDMSARRIKSLDSALSALGGGESGGTIRQLHQGIQEMVIMGSDSMMPFFAAMGVGVVDATGKIRAMDDILLDMSDSLSAMDPTKAYALASAMGLDDNTANALIQGRDALQEMLEAHNKIYVSTQAEIKAGRELSLAQSVLSKQWEGLKTIIGNALIPSLMGMTKLVSGFVDFLNRNDRPVKAFFQGLAVVVGVVLIPVLVKAAVAVFAMLSPFLAVGAAVVALAAAFGLLLEDYKVWAAGGKSLFDWTAFDKYIKESTLSVNGLIESFTFLLTGYKNWREALAGFTEWARLKGFIDDTGVSVKSFGTGIRNMIQDLIEAVPPLKSFLQMMGMIWKGDFKGALEVALKIPEQVGTFAFDAFGAVAERGLGAVDVALGHDPEEKGGLAQRGKGIIKAVQRKLGLGGEEEQAAEPESERQDQPATKQRPAKTEREDSTIRQHQPAPDRQPDNHGTPEPVIRQESGLVKIAQGKITSMADYKDHFETSRVERPERSELDNMLAKADEEFGLPAGTMAAVRKQETGNNQAYIDDPAKYHYEKNAQGKRIAGHTGQVSTAFGPFGILESTAKDPGWGVKPLQDKSLKEQIRFAAEYLAKRIEQAGGDFAKGLAGYGEGKPYAESVMRHISANQAQQLAKNETITNNNQSVTNNANRNVQVTVQGVTVNTSASTLEMATAEGLGTSLSRSDNLLNQVGGGL